MIDLFGNEFTEQDLLPKRKTIINKALAGYNYRKADGEKRCKNCALCFVRKYQRRYYKCRLVGDSASFATDIKANNVCDAWMS